MWVMDRGEFKGALLKRRMDFSAFMLAVYVTEDEYHEIHLDIISKFSLLVFGEQAVTALC